MIQQKLLKIEHGCTTLKTSRARSNKMKIRDFSETNLSMCIFELRAFLGICKQMVKTTHEFLIKSTKHLLFFIVPTQTPATRHLRQI